MDILLQKIGEERTCLFIPGRGEMLNRALNILGFSRCVPEKKYHTAIRVSTITLRFIVHFLSNVLYIDFVHFLLTSFVPM